MVTRVQEVLEQCCQACGDSVGAVLCSAKSWTLLIPVVSFQLRTIYDSMKWHLYLSTYEGVDDNTSCICISQMETRNYFEINLRKSRRLQQRTAPKQRSSQATSTTAASPASVRKSSQDASQHGWSRRVHPQMSPPAIFEDWSLQNHRTVKTKRELWGSSGPASQLKEGLPELVAQDYVQMAFEYLQGWRLQSPSGQPLPALKYKHYMELKSLWEILFIFLN